MRPVLLTALVALLAANGAPAHAQIQDPSAPPPGAASSPPPPPASSLSMPRTPNPFATSVPAGELSSEPLALTIGDAIQRALAHNLGVLLAGQDIDRADGARVRVLSDLLPNISGRISETRQQINLAAFGFPLPAGFPNVVGPFNVFDARVYLTQNVLDFKAMNDARAESHTLEAARHDYKSARDLVVLGATVAYAQALATQARVEAALAQVDTAQALYNQAADLKQGGLVAGIEVLRADVELATERQRSTAARNDAEKAKLQLARLIGLPIGQTYNLASPLTMSLTIPDVTLEQALDRAYRTREDYQAALERVKAAEASRAAASGENLPAIRVTGNYGDLGLSISDSHGTFAVVGALDVPIFNGGKTRGRLLEADAELRSRRADADEMKSAIYYEVRTALLDLQAGNEQVQVATRARQLAADQLTQARDRFAAGVAGNIEVVQAQGAVTLANDQYIAGVYTTQLARGALVRAMGIAEATSRELFGGAR